MRKIHGRPLLPWWVYVGYFLLGIYVALSHAFGAEMPTQTVKINEDSLARAIVKAMKASGRNGDTELAHVNKGEKKMLKDMGGAGTKNPKTGMPEFYEEGGGYESSQFDFSGPSGPAGPPDLGAMGGPADPIDPGTVVQDPFGSKPTSLVDQISKFASKYPTSPSGLAAFGLAKGLGKGIGEPLDRALGGQGIAEAPQFDATGRMGAEGRNDALMQQMAVEPGVTQAPAYMRPAQMEPPANLGLQGLSDIQKRTMMATYGSQGAQSQYRTPEAMRAYGNLIARALIGDNNQVTGNETGTLPIEDQYLRQVFGINKPNSAQALLDALKPYWSQ